MKNRTFGAFAIIAAVGLAVPVSASAVDAEVLNQQLDFDRDRKLDPTEVRIGLIHRDHTLNLPAIAAKSPTERKVILNALLVAHGGQALEDKVAQLEVEYRTRAPYALGAMDPRVFGLRQILINADDRVAVVTMPKESRLNLAVRRTREDTIETLRSTAFRGDPGPDALPEGALLSYSRNQRTDESAISAVGTLGFSWSLTDNPDYDASFIPEGEKNPVGRTIRNDAALRTAEIFLLASIDRNNTTAAGEPGASNPLERDKLEFELGVAGEFAWGEKAPLGLEALGVSGSLVWTTDSEIRQNIWGGRLDLTPVLPIPGFRNYFTPTWAFYRNQFGRQDALFSIRYWITLSLLGGTVEESNSNDFLRLYDSFLYGGAKFDLDLLILPDLLEQRLALHASYERFYGLSDGVDGTDEFRASLRYYLPLPIGLTRRVAAAGVESQPYVWQRESILWSLQVEYRKGESPITLEKDHSITAGVGIAY